MKSYDEESLEASVKKSQIKKNLPKLKEYLYQSLLENIVFNRIKKKKDKKHSYWLYLQSNWLKEKGLYKQAMNLNSQALKHSEQNEDALMSLNNMLMKLSLEGYNSLEPQQMENFEKNWQPFSKKLLHEIQTQYDSKVLYFLQAYTLKFFSSETKNTIEEQILLNKIEDLISNIESSYPIQNLFLYNEAANFYRRLKNDVQAYIYYKKAWDILRCDLSLIEKEPFGSVAVLHNLLTVTVVLNFEVEVEQLFKDFEWLKEILKDKLNDKISQEIKNINLRVRLGHYIRINALAECSALIPRLNSWLSNDFNLHYNVKKNIEATLVQYYYLSKEYDVCLRFILNWLHEIPKKAISVKATGLLLQILIHAEEGNFDICMHLMKPALKYFKECGLLSEPVEYLMKMCMKAFKQPLLYRQSDFFQNVFDGLKVFDQTEKFQYFSYFSVHAFLKWKINRSDYNSEYYKIIAQSQINNREILLKIRSV